jgi:hypothetical protein
MALDHSYSTDYVWQMALQGGGTPTIEVAFVEVGFLSHACRLPRKVERLADE